MVFLLKTSNCQIKALTFKNRHNWTDNERGFITADNIIQYGKKESNRFKKKNGKNIKNVRGWNKKIDKITKLCKITYWLIAEKV